jgi:hypothetical protein
MDAKRLAMKTLFLLVEAPRGNTRIHHMRWETENEREHERLWSGTRSAPGSRPLVWGGASLAGLPAVLPAR